MDAILWQLLIHTLIYIPEEFPIVVVGCPSTHGKDYSAIAQLLEGNQRLCRLLKHALIGCKYIEDCLTGNIYIVTIANSNSPIYTANSRVRVVIDNRG